MKKTFSFILLISVLLISLIFSCKLPGDSTSSNNGNSGDRKKTAPSSIKLAAKKLKSAAGTNAVDYLTQSTKTAKDAASSTTLANITSMYPIAVELEFAYNTDNKEVIVTEIQQSKAANDLLGSFKITKEDLDKLISAINNGLIATAATKTEKEQSQFTAKILENGKSADKNLDKIITVLKGSSITGDTTNTNRRFFDLGEDNNAANDTTALSGVTGVFSYMIDDKDVSFTTLSSLKTQIEAYESKN